MNPFVLLLVVANILSADAREANVCPYYSVFVESERDDTERSQSTGWEAAEQIGSSSCVFLGSDK